jgi:hypothetical protein
MTLKKHNNTTSMSRPQFDGDGYDPEGYSSVGYDRAGFWRNGWHMFTQVNKVTGRLYDEKGFDSRRRHEATGTRFDADGVPWWAWRTADGVVHGLTFVDDDGFNEFGFTPTGINRETKTYFDRDGFDSERVDIDGYDRRGFFADLASDRFGAHKETGTAWNSEGFNWLGVNDQGFDTAGRWWDEDDF